MWTGWGHGRCSILCRLIQVRACFGVHQNRFVAFSLGSVITVLNMLDYAESSCSNMVHSPLISLEHALYVTNTCMYDVVSRGR